MVVPITPPIYEKSKMAFLFFEPLLSGRSNRCSCANTGTRTKTKTAFLEWFSDYKNGPPLLSFGGFKKRSAIFLVLNEEPEKIVLVFDVSIGTT